MAKKKRADHDSPWKRMLRLYFPQAIEFFFPDIHCLIDWQKPYEFLDKEFQKIARDAEQGNRYADKLVKVWFKDGKSGCLLLHVEIQAKKEDTFPQRMLTYSIRIYDLFHTLATSLAILCDENADWRPQGCILERPETRLVFEFGSRKLIDYRSHWSMLESSPSPFATIVMAHLKTQETKRSPKQRKIWKFSLMRRLYEQGWERQDIRNLYEFLDWVMILPEPIEDQFWQELKQFEEAQNVAYITNAERIGRREGFKQGREEGMEQTQREIAIALLREGMSIEKIAQVTKLSIEQIQQLQSDSAQ